MLCTNFQTQNDLSLTIKYTKAKQIQESQILKWRISWKRCSCSLEKAGGHSWKPIARNCPYSNDEKPRNRGFLFHFILYLSVRRNLLCEASFISSE